MRPMLAVVVDPAWPGRLPLRDVDMPAPAPDEALVQVQAISLDPAEAATLAQAPAGTRPGRDFAGIVVRDAADGSGPKAGSRVAGLVAGGSWAEYVAARTSVLVALPDAVSLIQGATLPITGHAALDAAERAGSLLGRNVLIAFAVSGVAVMTCQLTRFGGSGHIVAVVPTAEREQLAHDSGAHHVVAGEGTEPAAQYAPYDRIFTTGGGEALASALAHLSADGLCVTWDVISEGQRTLDTQQRFPTGSPGAVGAVISRGTAHSETPDSLSRLARLAGAGVVRPYIGREAFWTEIATTADDLLQGRFPGNAVLHVGSV